MVMTDTRLIGVDSGGFPTQPDSDNIVRSVDGELIEAMDLTTPLINMFGGLSGFQVNSVKYFWPKGDNWSRRPTHGGLAATDTTTWVLTAQAHRYPIGNVFKLESELIRIIAIQDANNVTVTRGYAGTTPAIHASTVEALYVGSSMHESDNWVYRPTPVTTLPYNYLQMTHVALRNSWRRQHINLYGVNGSEELDKYTADTLAQYIVGIEGGFITSERFAGSVDEPATSGGLMYYCTSANGSQVTDKGGAAFQPSDITSQIDTIAKTWGIENVPKTVIMDSWAKQKVSAYYAGSKRLTQGERVGGTVIDMLSTEWGDIKLLMHNSLPYGNTFLVPDGEAQIGHLEGVGLLHVGETQETQGPFSGRYIYGDFGYRFRNMVKFGRIHNYSLTS